MPIPHQNIIKNKMEEKAKQLKGLTQEEFESQRRVIALNILKQTQEFIAWDLQFNNHISNLAEELVKQLKANPRILESNQEIRDILKEMRGEKGEGADLAGGDIIGGNVWDDIFGVIKELLLGEKEFIQKIISKIFDL